MKNLLGVIALAGTAAACQSHSEATTAAVAAPAAPVVAVAHKTTSPAAPTPAPADARSADFLRRYDLSPVLAVANEGDLLPGQRAVMNGFYGPDNYHMELVLTSVTRDPSNPGRYLVQGKDRYKGIITPLAGTIDLTQVKACPIDSVASDGTIRPYTALGVYELREDPSAHGAGVFRGRIAADLGLDKQDKPLYVPAYDTPSKGGGITYTGDWTSLATGQRKPATWVVNLFEYQGPQVASDFMLGERDPQINPKYAKLGWNKYWENDEWWVESPKLPLRR